MAIAYSSRQLASILGMSYGRFLALKDRYKKHVSQNYYLPYKGKTNTTLWTEEGAMFFKRLNNLKQPFASATIEGLEDVIKTEGWN